MSGLLLTYTFPFALLLLNLGAAAMSFYSHDLQRGAYWCASAVCILCVAFGART